MSSLPLVSLACNDDDYNGLLLLSNTASISPLKKTSRSSVIPPTKPNRSSSSSSTTSSSSSITIDASDEVISQYYKNKIDPQLSFLQDKSHHKILKTCELIKQLSIYSTSLFQNLYDDITNINNKISKLSNDCHRISKLCNEVDKISATYDSNEYSNIRANLNHGIFINEMKSNQLLPSSMPKYIKEKYSLMKNLTNLDDIDKILSIDIGETSKKISDSQLFFRVWKEKQENKIRYIQNLRDNKPIKKKKKKESQKSTSTFMSIFKSMTETNKTDVKLSNIEKLISIETFFKLPEKEIPPPTPPPKTKRPSHLQPSSPMPITPQKEVTTTESDENNSKRSTIPFPPPPPPPPPPPDNNMCILPPQPPPPNYPNPNKSPIKPAKPSRQSSSNDCDTINRKESIDDNDSLHTEEDNNLQIKANIDNDKSLIVESQNDISVKEYVGNVAKEKKESSRPSITENDARKSFELDKSIETRISIPNSLLESIKSHCILTDDKTPPLSPSKYVPKNSSKINFNKEDMFEQIRRGSLLKKVDQSNTQKKSSLGIFDSDIVTTLLARRTYLEHDQSDDEEDDNDDEWA